MKNNNKKESFPQIVKVKQRSFKEKYRKSLEKPVSEKRAAVSTLYIPESLTKAAPTTPPKEEERKGGVMIPETPGMGLRWEKSNGLCGNNGLKKDEKGEEALMGEEPEERTSALGSKFRDSLKRAAAGSNALASSGRAFIRIPSYSKIAVPSPSTSKGADNNTPKMAAAKIPNPSSNGKQLNPITSTPSSGHQQPVTCIPGQLLN